MKFLLLTLALCAVSANAYWLMGIGSLFFPIKTAARYSSSHIIFFPEDFITTERIDPVVDPGKVSAHVHSGMLSLNYKK